MIGRSGQDGDRAIDLLGEHDADQGVGPGLDAEGQGLAGLFHKVGIKPVGAADDEDQATHPIIAQFADFRRQGAGGMGGPPLVAGNHISIGQLGAQHFGLGGFAGLFAFHFKNFHRTKPQDPATGGRAFGVVGGEAGFSAGAQSADGEKGNPQPAPSMRWRESTAQIFSML